ncbi:MAG TPA: DUF4124 domain-containing protein [Burkholderiales bacterium]|nr:DUF4124 domain-containing protein [Burkholderiales bacterium]
MVRVLVIGLLLGAPLAHADTYKWVDANGVVNYSNAPPPDAAKGMAPQTVPDRMSSYSVEPVVNNPVDVYRRLDADQQDWLQRQQLMAMQAAATPAPAVDYATYYPAYGFVPARRALTRSPFFTPVKAPRLAPRAALRGF